MRENFIPEGVCTPIWGPNEGKAEQNQSQSQTEDSNRRTRVKNAAGKADPGVSLHSIWEWNARKEKQKQQQKESENSKKET